MLMKLITGLVLLLLFSCQDQTQQKKTKPENIQQERFIWLFNKEL